MRVSLEAFVTLVRSEPQEKRNRTAEGRESVREFTLDDLVGLTRTHAGEAEEGVLDGDIVDVLFTHLGYDSVALMEVLSHVKHEYGIDLAEDAVDALRTPRAVIEKVNEVIRSQSGERKKVV
ncbi:acyl carrier protein [Streptomyces scabiei]|uniref:acyl carrier protein n=1 Tax=Streptomyces scabiei TaxID=1930 RepID=UPI00299FFA72|nr:acyl carrier protein [Streptomyces scabiei]MDX3117017.1 acyl carrier protein [Streptomyces scabiei]